MKTQTHKRIGFKIISLMMVAASALLAGCSSGTSNADSPLALHLKNDEAATLQKSWEETPIPFYISNNVPERLVSPILDSLSRWEDVAGRSFFVYMGRTEITEASFDGKNVISFNTTPDAQGRLGNTHIKYNNNRTILEADIVIHGDPEMYADLECVHGESVCRATANKYDIGTLMIHESGHMLGFEHSEHGIMNPHFGMNDVIHTIDEDLVSELSDVYNPSVVAQQ